jgi:WD40 repeat protein
MAWGKIGWLLASAAALGSCTSGGGGACPGSADCGESVVTDAGAPFRPAAAGPACGNGVLDPGEECDDGSACADGRSCTDDRYRCDSNSRASCQPHSGDGCSVVCTLEPPRRCSTGDDTGMDCAAGEMPAPALPIDTPPASAPATPGPNEAGDPGGAPLDGSDTSSEPPGCTLGEFGPPEPIRGLDASLSVWAPALSPDGQTLYFAASPSNGIEAIYAARRVRRAQVAEATRLAALESGAGEGTPFQSFDGLSLFFYSLRAGDDDRDLWQATRPDPGSPFEQARLLPGINTFALDHLPWLSVDGLTLLFVSNRDGSQGQSDIWISTRPTPSSRFAVVQPVEGVNSSADEGRAVLARDGKTIFFASDREGGQGAHDLWTATRAAVDLPFGIARNLDALNAEGREMDAFLSANERELWFASDRGGSVTLWRSVRDCAE